MEILFQWRQGFMSGGGPEATTRLVLCALSNHMNGDGASCYPSIARLAEETGLNKKTVIRHIKKAVSAGWIEKSKKGFSGQGWRRHEYRAAIPDSFKGGGTESP